MRTAKTTEGMQFAKIGEIMGIAEIAEITKRAKPRRSWEARNYARKGDDPAETNPRRQGYMPPYKPPTSPLVGCYFVTLGPYGDSCRAL